MLLDNGWADRNADCCVNTVHEKNTRATNLVNFGPVTPEISWLICMGGECTLAKIRYALVFKGHSVGGSSTASLYVSKKCTVALGHAGWATRWALPRFLVRTDDTSHVVRSLYVRCSDSQVARDTIGSRH